MSSEKDKLEDICTRLSKDCIIVSAFDNDGAVSYPAAFDCVIGVDASNECKNSYEYEYVDNSIINIRAKGCIQKVPWVDPSYIITQGSSYACAYAAAIIYNFLDEYTISNINELKSILRTNAKLIYKSASQQKSPVYTYFSPGKSYLFPFNKEMHSFLSYDNQIAFDIYGVADVRVTGNVNKNAQSLLNFRGNSSSKEYIIQNIDTINWSDNFDTFIIGHVEILNQLMNRDFIKEIICKCIEFHKNLICFSNITAYYNMISQLVENNCRVYSPYLNENILINNQFGKLYKIPQPVVCIAGTSSSQGKFTLQLYLRKKLLDKGFNVGQLGTEPASLLFGMDEVYHYGYSVNNTNSFELTVSYVNKLMNNISDKKPDIIITGTQSGTVPYIYNNIAQLTNRQFEILTAILPDIVILCINPQDDIAYIKRTINTIESYINTTVLCCVLYQMKYSDTFQVYSTKVKLDEIESNELIESIRNELKIPVFTFNDTHMEELVQLLLEYFI